MIAIFLTAVYAFKHIATVIVKVTDVSKVALDNAWQGMLHYWETRGTESDLW